MPKLNLDLTGELLEMVDSDKKKNGMTSRVEVIRAAIKVYHNHIEKPNTPMTLRHGTIIFEHKPTS